MGAMREQVYALEEFFAFHESPRYLEDPLIAERAIQLLDKIKEVTGVEHVFTQIQQGAAMVTCTPEPRGYSPGGINIVLGRYDRQYFADIRDGFKKSA